MPSFHAGTGARARSSIGRLAKSPPAIAARLAILLGASMLASSPAAAAAAAPLLLRSPSMSATQIAFLKADDLWSVPRQGGAAIRLTTGGLVRGGPVFSPDGRWIAFAAVSGGSTDLFVMPAAGGEARRVTWHPDAETLIGWTADGKEILFTSNRISSLRNTPRLFHARVDGAGTPEPLPLPTVAAASFSPDGRSIAYLPFVGRSWKGYRGGRATYIWLLDLASLDKVEIPHTKASDWNPLWIGDKVYFLSDRDGIATLYAYDVATRAVTRLIDNRGFDFVSAQAGPDGIVIDAFDAIKTFDPATGSVRTTPIRLAVPDTAPPRRRVRLPGSRAVARILSPDGSAYALEARGDIFVAASTPGAPARNLTDSPAIADRHPFWSPDGKQIGYVSDASGEYRLILRSADGGGRPRELRLSEGRGVFDDFAWAPGGRHIAFTDERGALWALDLRSGRSARILVGRDGNAPDVGGWSRDGRRLAFTSRGPNRLGLVSIWSADTGKITAVSDGRLDAFGPTFDRAGDRLYFLASGDRPIATISTSGAGRMAWTAAAYAADLDRLPSPTAVSRLAAPEKEYRGIVSGNDGAIYLLEGRAGEDDVVWRLAAPAAKAEPYLTAQGFDLVADGRMAVVRRRGEDALVPLAGIRPATGIEPAHIPAGKTFTVPDLPLTVDPKAEWKQIFHEGWRFQRDLFYSGDFAGADLAKEEARYAPFLAGLGTRSELTYLMREMFTVLRVSHQGVIDPPKDDPASGPVAPAATQKPGGLLGADYEIDGGRYRFKRIYGGDVWSAEGPGPLARPGVAVKAGDYLIGIGGREIHATDNLDRAFEGLAGRSVEIRVADDASGKGARSYEVTPVASEFFLRHAAWIEDNRAKVDRLSGGKLGYVYIINTGDEGYNGFNRQYLAQLDKRGIVFDERNNGGGPVPEYFIDRLERSPKMLSTSRYSPLGPIRPNNWIDGPSAMIANESAGSGGDMLPYMYQKAKIGPIVGTRTWGGTIGSGLVPVLLDGGSMSVPHYANSDPDGTWGGLEGSGVVPDIPVVMEPKAVMAGRDPQLEAAVKAVMDELAAHPRPRPIAPPSRAAGGR